MVFDRRAGGHAFNFSSGVCAKCGMTREHFQDNDKPACKGKPSAPPDKPIMVADE
jgi:ribosomal protein L37E